MLYKLGVLPSAILSDVNERRPAHTFCYMLVSVHVCQSACIHNLHLPCTVADACAKRFIFIIYSSQFKKVMLNCLPSRT